MSKKVGIFITIGVIICVLGGGGIFGGLYYQAVSQIEVDIDDIYITDYSINLFDQSMDVDLEIHASISNPTSIAVEIEYALFEIYFDGVYSGEGQTSSFAATQTPSTMIIDTLLDDIDEDQFILLYDLIIMGNSKVATIRITTVHAFGFAIDINQDINVTVSQSDIL